MSKAQEVILDYDWRNEPIQDEELATIQAYATRAELNMDAASEQMFGVPARDLTFVQGQRLSSMMMDAALKKERAARLAQHHHRSFECGGRVECYKTECTERTGHCGSCREGISRNTYARQQSRVWGGRGEGW